MKLYHGTSSTNIKRILKTGIQPRNQTGRNNWKKMPSGDDRIYLTDAYAGYFAINAVKKTGLPTIIEIDTNKLYEPDLVPDEDFMEQITRGHDNIGFNTMEERTEHYRDNVMDIMEMYPAMTYQNSLQYLGTCAHMGTIPSHAITRIAYLDHKNGAAPLVFMFADPSITLMNYRFVGRRYRYYSKIIFGDTPDPNDCPKPFPEAAIGFMQQTHEFPPSFDAEIMAGIRIENIN